MYARYFDVFWLCVYNTMQALLKAENPPNEDEHLGWRFIVSTNKHPNLLWKESLVSLGSTVRIQASRIPIHINSVPFNFRAKSKTRMQLGIAAIPWLCTSNSTSPTFWWTIFDGVGVVTGWYLGGTWGFPCQQEFCHERAGEVRQVATGGEARGGLDVPGVPMGALHVTCLSEWEIFG